MTSLEGLFEGAGRVLTRNIRAAVNEGLEALAGEVRDLRKSVNRLHQTLAHGGGVVEPSGRRRRPVKLCLVEGCGRKHAAKGLCKNHYQQWLNRKKKEGPNAPKPGGVPRTVGKAAKKAPRPARKTRKPAARKSGRKPARKPTRKR